MKICDNYSCFLNTSSVFILRDVKDDRPSLINRQFPEIYIFIATLIINHFLLKRKTNIEMRYLK